MSMNAYEKSTDRLELYNLLKDGMQDVNDGNTRPLSLAMAEIKCRRKT